MMDQVVLLMIFGNCITLMMFYSDDRSCTKHACRKLQIFESLFSAFALLEALIRITAAGLRGYWADAWNRLDFIIVLCGYVFTACAARTVL